METCLSLDSLWIQNSSSTFIAASTEVGWLLVGVNYVRRINLALVNQRALPF